ncbi:SRPBCC family protein [Parvibaculum sp.]|uniref:SRPBCC family protein n=1 Tax=Parvibaculum sp. TaxID=2024848 RepID=UPI002BC2B0BD|nr:SRPBCC family protein [Parvibaculum sp.]HUD53395.1 SRPBCC family protein [Parvibaculum sp.]
MKIVLVLLAVLAAAVAALLVYAATRPDTFRYERRIGIKAPPEKIYPLIADFGLWRGWSPYENRDPEMKRSYSGTQGSVGAGYAWSGNKNIGTGSMKLVEAAPPSRLVMKLDFISPFEAHNRAEFTLTPKGDETEVTWAMYGPATFTSKMMGLVFNVDRMVGTDFETGLAALKAEAEKQGEER